jgi:hypothetical protein
MNSPQLRLDPVVQFFQWMERTAKAIGIKVAVHREYHEHWPEVVATRAFLSVVVSVSKVWGLVRVMSRQSWWL